MSKNILIGSGLSALGFLENLNKDINLESFDKNTYFGGHGYSHKFDDCFIDEGAHISHTKDKEFLDYIDANNLKRFTKFNSKIVNYYQEKKIGYPIQLNLKDLTFSEKFKYLKSFFLKTKKLEDCYNYYDWLVSTYGKFLADKYYSMYTKKYWRTDPSDMSLDWVKGRLAEKNIFKTLISLFLELKNSSLVYDEFRYPKKNGFFDFFINKFKQFDIKLDHNVKKISIKKKKVYFSNGKSANYDYLISSIPLVDYLNILEELPEEMSRILNSLKYTKLATYNYKILKKKDYDFHWCYFYDSKIPISRMSILNNWNDENKDNYYLVQGEVFFRNDETFDMNQCDKRTKEHIIKFFNLESDKEILLEKKIIVEKAYPVPLLNQKKNIEKIKSWLQSQNIYQIGLYGNWQFMWSDQAFNSGKQAAEIINTHKL
jgi:protoporphyrinogen oxidase